MTASLASSAITNRVNLVAIVIANALVDRCASWCSVCSRGQAVHDSAAHLHQTSVKAFGVSRVAGFQNEVHCSQGELQAAVLCVRLHHGGNAGPTASLFTARFDINGAMGHRDGVSLILCMCNSWPASRPRGARWAGRCARALGPPREAPA